jgi:hypothetical protein
MNECIHNALVSGLTRDQRQRVAIFSQGSPADFGVLATSSALNVSWHLDTDLLEVS